MRRTGYATALVGLGILALCRPCAVSADVDTRVIRSPRIGHG